MHGTLDSVFRIEWRPLSGLAEVAAAWRDLASRTIEPNVFYEPGFVLAAEPVFGAGVGAGLVWSRGRPARLLGLFPARVERRRFGLPLPVLVGWTHPFAPLGAPLVDRAAGAAVLEAWFDHLSGSGALPGLLLLPYFPEEGALAQAVEEALARRGARTASFGRHRRALLAPGAERNGCVERALGHKRHKELRRQLRRLGETGALAIAEAREPMAVRDAVEAFLTLEAAGWKGRAGTAARSLPEVARFLETTVVQLATEGKASVTSLTLDGRAIASLVVLRSGDAAWCWKIAYDESTARFSPGVQLLVSTTASLLAQATLARVDSCAVPDHPMIDHIWRERLTLSDRLIDLGGGRTVRFALACRLEGMRRTAVSAAKRARSILRRD